MQCSIVQVAYALAGQHDNVQIAQLSTVLAERLTADTFDLVTINCSADIFLGNNQTQPTVCQVVLSGKQQ